MRCRCPGTVAAMTKIATPFGPATLVERVSLPQKVGDRRFTSLVELLETERGDQLVRIAYSTDGVGPAVGHGSDLRRLEPITGTF